MDYDEYNRRHDEGHSNIYSLLNKGFRTPNTTGIIYVDYQKFSCVECDVTWTKAITTKQGKFKTSACWSCTKRVKGSVSSREWM